MPIIKRCGVCSQFRAYQDDDRFCVSCGHEGLDAACECGRSFDFAVNEPEGELHCPRCGRPLRGRSSDFV
ncbi:MAG TPA: hypothetical protein VFK16_06145 [Gemmatimonadaceae bacterium]|jgi:hypothetical protein|nr:hypothetical protein [Gemmatimonadaceae bacterium]